MDLGVLGLEAVVADLEKAQPRSAKDLHHATRPDNLVKRLEKEEEEFQLDPSKFSSTRRTKALDKLMVVRTSITNLRIPILIALLVRFALNKLTSPDHPLRKHTPRLSWSILAMMLAYKFRSLPPNNPNPRKAPWFFPLVGHLYYASMSMDDPHGLMLKTTKDLNFETFELSFPGNNLMVLSDARDREYALRKNWRLFQKNQDNSLVSGDVLAGELLGRGIFSTDNSEWRAHRKIASHMFSANALREKMERVFREHSDKFAHALVELSLKSDPVFDLQDLLTSVVFDGFCEIAFGIDPRAMEQVVATGTKPAFLISFDALQGKTVQRFLIPPVAWHIARIFGVGVEGEIAHHKKVVDDYILKIVQDRMARHGQHEGDLLSLYIDHAKQNNVELDAWYLRDTIMSFMVAGRDTTSCTLTNCFRFLSENPSVERKLVDEFEAIRDKQISWEDAKSFVYPNAFFNEVMRSMPPVPNMARICIENDQLPSGRFVRAGTAIVFAIQAIGQDPHLFPNPDKFTPERWIVEETTPVRRPDEYVFPVFLGGPRLCLGKDMARLETMIFLKKILIEHGLRIRVEPKQNLVKLGSGPVAFYVHGMRVKVSQNTKHN